MKISTALNPANQLVTKIQIDQTTLSYFVDKYDTIDVFATSTHHPDLSYHDWFTSTDQLNDLIQLFADLGKLDHKLKLS